MSSTVNLLLQARNNEQVKYSVKPDDALKVPINPAIITEIVCNVTGVNIRQIESATRKWEVMFARTMLAAYLNENTSMSHGVIAMFLGIKRSSTTIAINKFPSLRFPVTMDEKSKKFVDDCKRCEELLLAERRRNAKGKALEETTEITQAEEPNKTTCADSNKTNRIDIDQEMDKITEVHATDIHYGKVRLRAVFGHDHRNRMFANLSYQSRETSMFIRLPMFDFMLLFDDIISMIQTPELVQYITSKDYYSQEDKANSSNMKISCTFARV